jgi:hypothetical protein
LEIRERKSGVQIAGSLEETPRMVIAFLEGPRFHQDCERALPKRLIVDLIFRG